LDYPDILKQGDVVFMNNVFQFFSQIELHRSFWNFVMQNCKLGTILVTTPSLEQQFDFGKVALQSSFPDFK